MELIVDNEPRSLAAKVLNLYSRANVKLIEVSRNTSKHLSLSLPVLSHEDAIRHPLSIYSFLASLSKTSTFLIGENCLEKAQTSSWVELANSIPAADFIDYLEKKLLSRTFLVSNHITLADIAAYTVVWTTIGGVTFSEKNKYPCIMRWASHLMALPGLNEYLPLFEIPQKVNRIMESYELLLKNNPTENSVEKKLEEEKKVEAKEIKNENTKKTVQGKKGVQEKKEGEGGKNKKEEEKKVQPKKEKKVLTEEQLKEIEAKKLLNAEKKLKNKEEGKKEGAGQQGKKGGKAGAKEVQPEDKPSN